ncbi:hypothetical protein, partial [Flavobacterium sp.]|uniref:hypothetical protein n=1 Tax=Flavobacterium sp. TaxID=239 RepID=UPI003B98ECDA
MKLPAIVLLFTAFFGFAQPGASSTNERTDAFIPPSPSVSALMKYEEIPVSNYTGVPSIDVPIFNHQDATSNFSFPVSLSYHTGNIKQSDVATEVGLGWSLKAGGCVSRVVQDVPDEMAKPMQKYGIYRSDPYSSTVNFSNTINYLTSTEPFSNLNAFLFAPNANMPDNVQQFLWETTAKGKYDTKHDLWQFNFGNYTGRFIIKKNAQGILHVVLLEHSNLKVINHYDGEGQNGNSTTPPSYTPTGFTIVDTYGNRYIFDIVENVTSSTFYTRTYQNNVSNLGYSINFTCPSTFYLSRVENEAGQVLATLEYEAAAQEEPKVGATTRNTITSHDQIVENWFNQFVTDCFVIYTPINYTSILPTIETTKSSNLYEAKKVKKINIVRKGSIEFTYTLGREDENIVTPENCVFLDKIDIKAADSSLISTYDFSYTYIDAVVKKLFLRNITLRNGVQGESIRFREFRYKEIPQTLDTPHSDYWGYLKDCRILGTNTFDKETDDLLAATFSLEEIILPTDGKIKLEFEPNTYSAIGTEVLDNFDANPNNWDYFTTPKTIPLPASPTAVSFFTLYQEQDVYFEINNNFGNHTNVAWQYKLFKNNETTPTATILDFDGENPITTAERTLPPGNYTVKFEVLNMGLNFSNGAQAKITAHHKNKKVGLSSPNVPATGIPFEFLYGGGIRVKEIAYFNEINSQTPVITKSYDYQDENNSKRSSGALVSLPIFRQTRQKRLPLLYCTQQPTSGGASAAGGFTVTYNSISTSALNDSGNTKGGFVGYKNVTVYQTDLGRSVFTYTNATDYPDLLVGIAALNQKKLNYDYKRGLLLSEKHFENSSKLLKKVEYGYDFEQEELLLGLNMFGDYDEMYSVHPAFQFFQSYSQFKEMAQTGCVEEGNMNKPCYVGDPAEVVEPDLGTRFNYAREIKGWAKLTTQTTTEYFYEGVNQNPVTTQQSFSYNAGNRLVKQVTTSNSLGQELRTKTIFVNDSDYTEAIKPQLIAKNLVETPLRTEVYNQNLLTAVKRFDYSLFPNNRLLPSFEFLTKGAHTAVADVNYTKYDNFGNLNEYILKNNAVVSFIYGYQSTLPVAKIENLA